MIPVIGQAQLLSKLSVKHFSLDFFTDFESTLLDSVPACWFGFASYGLPFAQPRVDNAFPAPIAGTRSVVLASWFWICSRY